MGSTFGIWITYALDAIFFAGLAGCAMVVVFSWVLIVRDGFSKRDDEAGI